MSRWRQLIALVLTTKQQQRGNTLNIKTNHNTYKLARVKAQNMYAKPKLKTFHV